MTDSPALPLSGGCNCGAVRFEIAELPVLAGYCHCTRCQRRSGGASGVTAWVKGDAFRILQGEDRIRRWNAGDGNDKAFCVTCGSGLFSANPGDESFVFVRLGVIDGDPGIRPMGRQHVASAAVWEPVPDDGLPRFERGAADAAREAAGEA